MSDNVDLSWADGDVKTAATMIAGRAIAVRMAGPLTETPQAKAIIEKAAFSLDELKARAGQVSNSIQEWYKKDPSIAHGIGIGAGVGGLAGLGTSMASGGRRPVLDTALGALLGAGVGGAGTHFYNTTREAQQASDPDEVTLNKLKAVQDEEIAKAEPPTTIFGKPVLPHGDNAWKPKAPGPESIGGAFGAGAAPVVGGTAIANAGTLGLSRLMLGKGRGVMLPSWANKGLMGVAALSGGAHLGDRLSTPGTDFSPPVPTTPVTPLVNEAANLGPQGIKAPEFQDKAKAYMRKGGSFFTTSDIMGKWNSIPKDQQSAIMGGGIGAGIGGLTGLMSGKRKLRNSLLGAVMGGGLGAGAGYLYGQPSQPPQTQTKPEPTTQPIASNAKPEPTKEELRLAHTDKVLGQTGAIGGAATGAAAGGYAGSKLSPKLINTKGTWSGNTYSPFPINGTRNSRNFVRAGTGLGGLTGALMGAYSGAQLHRASGPLNSFNNYLDTPNSQPVEGLAPLVPGK